MSYTNAQVAALVKSLESRMANIEDTLAGSRPAAIARPVVGTAEAPLYVSSRIACANSAHAGECTRTFGKAEFAEGAHVACAGTTDPNHTLLRKSHKH